MAGRNYPFKSTIDHRISPRISLNRPIPKSFSPNGDEINDSFQIKFPHSTFNLQHLTLSIFDRWGGEVFSGEGVSSGWDGRKNGKDCPGGVYVYKIVFSLDGVPGSQERVGTVMLVR
ncbi:MAG: gliding motility-associated C-terminal domain-containing protein [Bacteroidales bacterium]|jgi:gliding motility-associated-like protein|nr:gliding motility-associated C-terminal domain-containing protein [Bacteroidales bacterium]